MLRRPAHLVVFAAAAAVSACASQQRIDGTTWTDDAREGIAPRSHTEVAHDADRSVQRPYARSVTIGSGADRRPGEVKSSEELELALIRFTTKRRMLMNHDAADLHTAGQALSENRSWPKPIESAFESVLGEMENGLATKLGSVPRRLLIQARVTLETEMEITEARFGTSPPALVERMGKLFAVIAMHMRASSPAQDQRPRGSHAIALAWPISPVIVTSPFGYRRDPILGRSNVRFHAGIDLGGDTGDLVHAAGPGRVVHAGWLGGHGRAVVVQHAGGYQTLYAHLRQILTSLGSEVDMGTPIGAVGSSGRSTGPHLHFEVHHGGAPIDPQEIVDTRYALQEDDPEPSRIAHASVERVR